MISPTARNVAFDSVVIGPSFFVPVFDAGSVFERDRIPLREPQAEQVTATNRHKPIGIRVIDRIIWICKGVILGSFNNLADLRRS